MNGHAAPDYWDDRGPVLLWFCILSGPAAWALDQLISYALVKPVCFADTRYVLTAISGGALLLVIAGGLVARFCLAKISGAAGDGGRTIDRSWFMAIVGLSLNLLVGLLILVATFPPFVLSPCE